MAHLGDEKRSGENASQVRSGVVVTLLSFVPLSNGCSLSSTPGVGGGGVSLSFCQCDPREGWMLESGGTDRARRGEAKASINLFSFLCLDLVERVMSLGK